MPQFDPAFKHPLKWSVNDNTFDDAHKNPRSFSLTIPVDSIPDLINHLMVLESDETKHKSGTVWDFKNQEEVEVKVVYINGKGKNGRNDSSYGNISPQKISDPSASIPF